jgi:hypothetical protein
MRQPLFIPPEVKAAIVRHLRRATAKAVAGFHSAAEDEDTLTGHFGAMLKTAEHSVLVRSEEISGTWTWSVDYTKFRGRGKGATENIIGADGVFEIRVKFGQREQRKSLLFRAKTDWKRDQAVFEQAVKMSTWNEAAFVLNYTESGFRAFKLEELSAKEA